MMVENDAVSEYSCSVDESDSDPGGDFGDGICPSLATHEAVFNTVEKRWAKAVAQDASWSDPDPLFVLAFLERVTGVPPLCVGELDQYKQRWSNRVEGESQPDFITCGIMRISTTNDASCTQPCKDVEYWTTLGVTEWPEFVEASSDVEFMTSSFRAITYQVQHLRRLVLAWSYILSSRWVEILKAGGEGSASIQQVNCESEAVFWDMIENENWQASYSFQDQVYYCPFMLKSKGWSAASVAAKRPVMVKSKEIFDLLLRFCLTHNLLLEFFIAMAIAVSSQRSWRRPSPTLLPWNSTAEHSLTTLRTEQDLMVSNPEILSTAAQLWERIDQILTLGSTIEGIESFVCEVSFDASLPCNIIGAQYSAIFSVLDWDFEGNGDRLLAAIRTLYPHLTLFWTALSACGQGQEMLGVLFDLSSPVCLAVAEWTSSVQSFWQMSYSSPTRKDVISRAEEFSLLFLTRPDLIQSLPRAPPHGNTPVKNLSLSLSEHLGHNHNFGQVKFYEKLSTNELRETYSMARTSVRTCTLQPYFEDKKGDSRLLRENWVNAFEMSSYSTRYMFLWYKFGEGGLWLDEGDDRAPDDIRELSRHPWLRDPFEDESEEEDVRKSPQLHVQKDSIVKWREHVAESEQPVSDDYSLMSF